MAATDQIRALEKDLATLTERVDGARNEIHRLDALSQERLQFFSLRLGDEDKRIHEAILRLEKEFKDRFSRLDELNKERVSRRWAWFALIVSLLISPVISIGLNRYSNVLFK